MKYSTYYHLSQIVPKKNSHKYIHSICWGGKWIDQINKHDVSYLVHLHKDLTS
jgi:hypothetical protein